MILLAHFDLFFFFLVHYKEIKSTTTKIASFSFPIFSQQPIEVYKSVTNQFKHAKKEKKKPLRSSTKMDLTQTDSEQQNSLVK